MFLFGHLGFGSWLAKPFIGADIEVDQKKRFLRPGLPLGWVLFGCVLPDLIDKPLYYGLSWWTGRSGADIGLISGTRTFGHTAIFALTISTISYFKHSRKWAAVAIGVATHLLLDEIGGIFQPPSAPPIGSSLLWPFITQKFPNYPYTGLAQHLSPTPYILVTEVAGAILLALTFRRYTQGKRSRLR